MGLDARREGVEAYKGPVCPPTERRRCSLVEGGFGGLFVAGLGASPTHRGPTPSVPLGQFTRTTTRALWWKQEREKVQYASPT